MEVLALELRLILFVLCSDLRAPRWPQAFWLSKNRRRFFSSASHGEARKWVAKGEHKSADDAPLLSLPLHPDNAIILSPGDTIVQAMARINHFYSSWICFTLLVIRAHLGDTFGGVFHVDSTSKTLSCPWSRFWVPDVEQPNQLKIYVREGEWQWVLTIGVSKGLASTANCQRLHQVVPSLLVLRCRRWISPRSVEIDLSGEEENK